MVLVVSAEFKYVIVSCDRADQDSIDNNCLIYGWNDRGGGHAKHTVSAWPLEDTVHANKGKKWG